MLLSDLLGNKYFEQDHLPRHVSLKPSRNLWLQMESRAMLVSAVKTLLVIVHAQKA